MKKALICSLCLLLNHGFKMSLCASDLVMYQGKLTDAAAAPVPDGQYRLGARIWDTASGGTTPLWSRKYQVPVTGGLFSLMLGATGSPWETPTPLTSSLKLATSGQNRWVEITVMSDANGTEKPEVERKVLLPRQSLTAVPFAHNGVPTGTVVSFAGSTAPDGWVFCDGTTLYDGADPRYAGLFATIGTTYGSGTGSQFKTPDMRGRVAAGKENMGGTGAGRLTTSGVGAPLFNVATTNLGAAGGGDRHTLIAAQMPSHNHDGSTGSDTHSHNVTITYYRSNGSGNQNLPGRATDFDGGALGHTTTSDTHSHTIPPNGSSQAHPTVQPTIILNYIIKL